MEIHKNVVIQTIKSNSQDKVILLDSDDMAASIAEVMRYDLDFRLAVAQGLNLYAEKHLTQSN